jgi:hypothetical protein
MLLHDLMDDAVADVTADLPDLARTSRRRGTTVRRRRRALTAVASVTTVSVLAAGGYALAPGDDGPNSTVAADAVAPVRVGELSGQTAPTTARGVAAALADAVDDVADGTFGTFQGDVYDHEAFAALLFEPATGSGPAGQVMINLQPLGMAGERPYDCDAVNLASCTVQQLTGGDILRTYREDDDTEFGNGSRRLAAELISPERRLRVVVNALNTNPWADGEMRATPVLTASQIKEIATLPWWSRTQLPVEYVEAGQLLEDYASTTGNDG